MGLDCCCRDGYSGRGVSDETSNNSELVSSTFRSLESTDTAPGHKCKKRNNRLAQALAAGRNLCSHRKPGRRPSTSSRLFDGRNSDSERRFQLHHFDRPPFR